MTSESALPPHLPTLTGLLEDYSATTGRPLSALARITGGQLTNLRLSNDRGDALSPAGLMSSLSNEIDQLIEHKMLPSECELRLHTVASIPPENPGRRPGYSSRINNDGLVLRSALLTFGHGSGYTNAEIREDAQRRGKTLPEISYYRSLVREGKVAEGPVGAIYASPIGSDFNEGVQADTEAEPGLPEVDTSGAVQPVLAHNLWVEVAHDSQTRYAVDLAPGPSGKEGQVIARPKNRVQVPYPVALSLAQFVTGRWLSTDVATVEWQTMISLLEPSQDTAQIFLESVSTANTDESYTDSESPGEGEEQADTEDEIRDLSGHLETHNADRLNETERNLADDLAAVAFGSGAGHSDTAEASEASAASRPGSGAGFKAALRRLFGGG